MKVLTIVNDLGMGGTQRGASYYLHAYLFLEYEAAVYLTGSELNKKEIQAQVGKKIVVLNDAEEHKIYAKVKKWIPDVIHIHANGVKYKDIAFILELYSESALILESCNFPVISDYASYVDVHLQYTYWCLWQFLYRKCKAKAKTGLAFVFSRLILTDNFFPSSISDALAFRHRLNIPKDAFVFGRIGQPFRDKWSPLIFQAFQSFLQKEKNAYLLLIGMPKELEIHYLSLPHLVKKRIILHPLIDDFKELRTVYQAMNVFLHAADQGETFGLVLIEAMLCGVPVISLFTPYRDNSQFEVLGFNKGGVIVRNSTEMLRNMQKLMDDQRTRKQLFVQGRAWILERYSRDAVCSRLQEIIERSFAAKKGQKKNLINHLGHSYSDAKSEINRQLKLVYGWAYILHLPLLFALSQTREPLHGKIAYFYRLILGHIPWRSFLHSFQKQWKKLRA